MSTRDWNAAEEASPADNDKRHLGDDEFRDVKVNVRETGQRGGHWFPGIVGGAASTTDNNRGRHVVDAGGSGVSPHIYKSDGTTKLVEYTDTAVAISDDVTIGGDTTISGAVTFGPPLTLNHPTASTQAEIVFQASGAAYVGKITNGVRITGPFGAQNYSNVSGPATLTLDSTTDASSQYYVDNTSGGVTINIPSSTGGGVTWLFYLAGNGGGTVSFRGPTFFNMMHNNAGLVANSVCDFPADWEGWVTVTQWQITQALMSITSSQPAKEYNNAGSPYTLTAIDLCSDVHFVDTSLGSVTINLPPASAYPDIMGYGPIRFIKTSSSNIMTISRSGADTINGATSHNITAGTNGTGFGHIDIYAPSGSDYRANISADAS